MKVIKLTSDKDNEQCDIFPCGSIRDMSYLEDIEVTGYPFVVIDKPDSLEECPACGNFYEDTTNFIGDMCVRCQGRYTKLDRI